LSFEIEKKFLVNNYREVFNFFKKKYGEPTFIKKAGFWWCSNYEEDKNILEIDNPIILKKDVEVIKDLTEFIFPVQDYQFTRIRVIDKNFYITFKNKSVVNKTEKNIEYEFEIERNTLKLVVDYLKDNALIFYYNIKETFEFHNNDIKIELSKFDVLKDYYIEIEVTGEKENILNNKLNEYLNKLEILPLLKEEARSYFELSMNENREKLKNIKLSTYSKNAIKNLINLMG